MTPVFLCVGAAKAGTSWLYRHLQAHPGCSLRAIKELHYFDALDGGTIARQLQQTKSAQITLLERTHGGTRANDHQAGLIVDQGDWLDVLERREEDIAAYLGYLRRGARDGQVVGELTPAYALLSEERLNAMARIAPDVRVLFLMRDPVERLWSHVRMIAGRRDSDGVVTERRAGNILRRTLAGEETQIVRRSDYGETIARLTAAVPAERLHFEVFEEMVQGPGYARICDFLGIAREVSDTGAVHEGQPLAMTGDQRRAAGRWLAPQYAAAEAVLARRPASWRFP